ncbi:galactokinase [Patescibacteria group bacterium]|nr:galactokinase [Patescibacteria group bacterium]
MERPIILSRTPFRIPLGGGSTDMPSYYEKYGGFIFAVSIDMYMDILIKKPISDDYVHMHYTQYESETSAENIRHTIGREALRMLGVNNKVSISFKADTPAGTGLGSSGACSVSLLKGLSLYKGGGISNVAAAEQSFVLTQNLGLPDGKQDPYACAIGGFSVLEIDKDGRVNVIKPDITNETADSFFENCLFFYTGIHRNSKSLLDIQDEERILNLKHKTKEIGQQIYQCFLRGDLDKFGALLDKHWQVKKEMSSMMSNEWLNEVYEVAKHAGALGGKIMGAGGGGYFMFYCPTKVAKESVRHALQRFNMREMDIHIDEQGARAQVVHF